MPHEIYLETKPRMKDISNHEAHVRKRHLEILEHGQAVKPPGNQSDPSHLALDALYRCGFLQSELSPSDDDDDEADVVYVFPSILHKR